METASVLTIEVLIAARRIISHPRRWCRHSGAETVDHTPVASDNPRAVRFCALGAIGRAALDAGLYRRGSFEPFTKDDVYRGQSALIASLDRLSFSLFGVGFERLQRVNDTLGRKAAIQVFDAAIAELRAGSARWYMPVWS